MRVKAGSTHGSTSKRQSIPYDTSKKVKPKKKGFRDKIVMRKKTDLGEEK